MYINQTVVPSEGILKAMHAMRNPMNSWDKSDTYIYKGVDEPEEAVIGPNDKKLAIKLGDAGPSHCKHLRFIMAYANIGAPLYWWKEFDTYRNGVEKISTSTMHKLTSRPIVIDDFCTSGTEEATYLEHWIIPRLNTLMDKSKEDKIHWEELIHELPSSYIQMRTVMMSYAAIKNICDQRKGHKLKEWHQFIDWAHELPNSWLIFGEGE